MESRPDRCQEAYLVFGVPETDDVGVSFWCTLQSGIVRLYVPEADPDSETWQMSVDFELEVAAKTYPLKGKTALNEEAAAISLEAELKTTDPVFSALQEANHFAVKVGASNHVFPLGEADFPSFLDVCGKSLNLFQTLQQAMQGDHRGGIRDPVNS